MSEEGDNFVVSFPNLEPAVTFNTVALTVCAGFFLGLVACDVDAGADHAGQRQDP